MAKRANGEGTLAARKDKTGKVVGWRAGIMVGRLEDGSPDRRWVCGKTQREVRDELQKLQGQQRGGTLSAHADGLTKNINKS